MGIYLLWMVTCYFRPGERPFREETSKLLYRESAHRHQVLLYPEDRPLRSKTCAANDTVELYCPWCATSLSHGNPTERIFSSSYHDFLVVWKQSDRGDKAGRHCPTTGAIHGTAQRTVHRRRPGHPNTKEDEGPRPMEIGPQRASPPSASGLPSLCPEMRKRVAQGDFRLHSHQQCSNASRSVFQFLPRRPRGACFVVVSSGACKVGRRIRQRGFLVGWCYLNLESTDLRRIRSDVRTGRVFGAVLCPSCASWSHCRDSHADQRCSHVWGQKPCSSHIQTGIRHFTRLLTLIRDLQKYGIPWIFTHPLSSHVWRIGSICSLEQHHSMTQLFPSMVHQPQLRQRGYCLAESLNNQSSLTEGKALRKAAHLLVWEFLFISRSWCSCIQRLEPGRGRLEHLVRARALALEALRVLTGPHVSVEQTL